MSCLYPRLRLETHKKYINKKGGISYEAKLIKYDPESAEKYEQDPYYRRVQIVPCQKCVECLLQGSRDKATLIMLEKLYHKNNECWFLTLTYDDEHLHFNQTMNLRTKETYTGASLNLKDFQNFMKKLRYYHPEKIMCVYAGEYGSKTIRPHGHFIVMGLKLDETKFIKHGINEMGDPLWEVPELNEIWGKGHITVGEVTWRSAAYVARYVLKKAFKKDKLWYQMQGLKPEFIHWGNGWGQTYIEEKGKSIYDTDSVPIKGGVKPPKKYDRILKEADPNLYEEIKNKRMEVAKANFRKETSLGYDEYQKVKEYNKLNNFKDLRRKEI